MTRYFSQITYQTGKQEIGTTFKAPIFSKEYRFVYYYAFGSLF